jgi:hypothetical protein
MQGMKGQSCQFGILEQNIHVKIVKTVTSIEFLTASTSWK